MKMIRDLFSAERPIDRRIEKVIDYTADTPDRLGPEIDEYVVTERIEDSFRRFIEVYEAGVRRADVTEVGVWVSGFYGSGKSSFTKYLGLALDPERLVGEIPFLERLVGRFRAPDLKQLFRVTATSFPATVVLLDLARDQLVESTAVSVANVLYAKVLQRVGYSKVPKLADIEVRLDEAGRLDDFRSAYRDRFPGKGEWEDVQDDPLIGPARASQLVPAFLSADFPSPESFRQQAYQERLQVSELADRMIRLLRRKTGRESIVFVVDEVGQYVAPRTDLMLNLDGLVRSFKELGRGKIWFVATAQQTLNEIVEKAILNSAELYRLRDRFPISLELDAADIREITHRRLLTKRTAGERRLREMFRTDGEVLRLQTRVDGFGSASANELDADVFAHMYPFLPLHFDLVMALIRRLARRTGGTGLRSAIRVVQDLLVDASRALPAGIAPLAERPVRRLACADDIFDTLRADIAKELPHVVDGVARVEGHRSFREDELAVRVAKAIAALQPLDDFPRTAENLAAVLYPGVGEASLVEQVRDVLRRLVDARELGIVELRGEQDADQVAAAGYLFLSDKVRPLQQTRDAHRPTGAEKRQLQVDLLELIFDPQPEARLEDVKSVRAGLALGTMPVAGEGADLRFLLEPVSASARQQRLEDLRNETRSRADWQATIVWLVTLPDDLDELLEEACRSAHLGRSTSEHDADRDVAQYIRAERRRLERLREAACDRLAKAMHDGSFVFRGLARPVREYDADAVIPACNGVLERAAADVYPAFRHAALAAKTNQASQFLGWERLDRMPRERDPLGLVETRAGQPRVKVAEAPLSEALRAFREKADAAGTGRLQGSVVQDLFAAPPYGWFKDTTRYLFAALLAAGEIEVHTPAGVLRTAGPNAEDVFRNTASFNRVGLSPRGSRPSIEVLDRAARLLEGLFGVEVLPLEDHVSRAVRAQVPRLMERVGSLPDRLRLLGLPGEQRARSVLQGCSDLLQEDAGGAASILGAAESSLPADVRWAREAVDGLDGDGEARIRQAGSLRRELGELAELFPDVAQLAARPELGAIKEVLESESFASRIVDLGSAVVALEQAAGAAYAERRADLEAAVRRARDELEAMARWAALEPEDRDAVSARLSLADLPAVPPADKLVSELRRVLSRTARLSAVLAECKADVQRLAPAAAPPGKGGGGGVRIGPTAEQVVALSALVPAAPLDSPQAVNRWIEELRRRLIELVDLGPVRLVGREDE
ncbi:MAG: BREX system P-loop protein BrxC [Deltaproteobacteria bacterium]|nr:BREX system P-loop protein BrxC [Deltaproteobacteria bacterium]